MPYCVRSGAPSKEGDRFRTACDAAAARVIKEELNVSGSNLVDRVRELLHEGDVTRIVVKN